MANETVNKTEKKNPLDNLTPFSSDRQPDPAKLKAGWARRTQAMEMMNTLKKYMGMDYKAFQALLDDIKLHPENYTIQEIMLSKYATKAFNGDKFMLDWINRHISNAPIEHTGEDGGDITIRIKKEIVTTEPAKPPQE